MREMSKVHHSSYLVKDFRLRSGVRLAELRIAYAIYGELAPDRGNVILLTHGITSSHHAACAHTADPEGGWWSNLIGPGKAIDTDVYFVVSSNMLGSCFGSTGPASIDPTTGLPYGPNFPRICVGDMVDVQKALLDSLGIGHLTAVAGTSYGGYQALEWGVSYPGMMNGLAVSETALQVSNGAARLRALIDHLSSDPNWQDGWYYSKGCVSQKLADLRLNMMRAYGYEEKLSRLVESKTRLEDEMWRLASDWARRFDANSLIALRRASTDFNVLPRLSAMRARVLYVLSTTDTLFPPTIASDTMNAFHSAGVEARYLELQSPFGHIASNTDAAKWADSLTEFLRQVRG
jgi:homoserine O-acetyltransferase